MLGKLQDLHQETVRHLSAAFDAAAASGNAAQAEALFRLFPLVKEPDMGLAKFGKFLATKISEKADAQLALLLSMQTPEKPTVYVDMMTELLEAVAQAIQSNESVIQESYGTLPYFAFLYHLPCPI